ncbi:MAG TPA: trypsin-like peptidase domain-containing protein [Pyrinomonadaceae bacterium]
MASGLVIHIVAGEDKHTEVLSHERIRIGSGEGCDLRLRVSSLPVSANGTILELARANGNYRVSKFDSALGLTHNGEPLSVGAKITDGDEVRIEETNLALQFFPVRSLPMVIGQRRETQVAPFIENAAIESTATARRDDAKVFLREFTRELVREINTSTKLIALAITLALVGGVLYLGFAAYKEIQNVRRASEQLDAKQGQLAQDLNKTSDELSKANQTNETIRNSLSFVPKLVTQYSGGVCLISGSFVFVEPSSGRPLRYAESQMSDDGVVIQNGDQPAELTPEGNGAIAEYEFVGTGFYVGDGYVITNKHVAQPWLADERAQSLNVAGINAKPRLKKLVAYFPGHAAAITLKFKQAAAHDDLAVCTVNASDLPEKVPVLPLDRDSEAVGIGKEVAMMGYPNGPDRILAMVDDSEARSINARYGSSLDTLINYLSESKRIQPMTTRGYITDLDARRIVHSAQTAEGGSGAPLFGQSGRVIGINFAVFTENSASNFAVPVRYAITLLERAGWKSPEPVEAGQNENGNTNQAATRGSSNANASR